MHVACNSHALVFLGIDRGLAALARPMLIAATGVHDGSASTSVVGCVYAAMCCFCIVDCIGGMSHPVPGVSPGAAAAAPVQGEQDEAPSNDVNDFPQLD